MSTRIRNIPTVVEWADDTSTPRSFHHLAGPDSPSLQLSLSFDEQEQSAIFKIKIRVRLDGGGERGPQEAGYLYLWIQPQDVLLLLQDPIQCLHDGISTVLRGPTTCLRLVLSKPVCVVAPSDPLPLREGLGAQMLDSLILLTKQTILAIHVEQHQLPDQGKIERLCQAFCNGSVKQHPRHRFLSDFYKGRGAMVINDLASYTRSEVTSTAVPINGPNNGRGAIPPPYAEAPPPPPSIFAPRPSNKRQRVTSAMSATISPDLDGVYTELLAQQKAQINKFFELQQVQMADILERMASQVDKIPDQVTTRVDKCVYEEMVKIWDKKPREWEEVTRNIVQQEVDYALESSLPDKLEELKDDVRDECLDHLKDDLEGGLVTITLPR